MQNKRQSERHIQEKSNSKKDDSTNGEFLNFDSKLCLKIKKVISRNKKILTATKLLKNQEKLKGFFV